MNNWKEKIPAIFAEQGDILEVPLDAQTDSQVSFETGYTANYERDAVDDLGNPLIQYGIERTKFNYLMKVITSALKEIQETIPTYEDNGVDKVDVSSIVTDTNAFDVLESILCINADTGKASKITKDDIIKNLNPDVDLSNSNISVSQLATTAVDNFLALDGDIVKKADKLLQEAIAEINLSADNVVVSASATVDVVDSVIVMNTDGKVAKATTIPQEKIEEINLSKDNIAIDEYTDQEQGSVFKPVISSNTGSVYRKDKLEGSMIESIKFEQIEDDVYARSINCTIMTSDTYPDGIDNLIQTGVYHVITPDEYKDIINDQIDTADKEEYILKVMNSFLTNLNMIKEPFTDIASLVAYAGSDFISPYEPIIQVLGVSANGTDDTNVTQVFKLNGEVKGQRTFTATTGGLTNEVWIPVSTYIRDTIEEELIAFMYDGVPDEATGDLNILRTFKTIGYNNKEELSYGFSFGGFNCYDVITIDTDLDWTDKSDTVDSDVYVAAYTYNQSLLSIDDTKIIKLNSKVIEGVNDIANVKDVIFFVKDRTHNIKYIALGRETGGALFVGYLFDASNDEFLDTTKAKNFFRPNYHLYFDAMSCTDYYNFTNAEIKLRNIVIGADVKMFSNSTGVNTDTVIAKNLIVKDSSFNPVMTVTSASTTLSNELVVNNNLSLNLQTASIIDHYISFLETVAAKASLRTSIVYTPSQKEKEFLDIHTTTQILSDGKAVKGLEIDGVFYDSFVLAIGDKFYTAFSESEAEPISSGEGFPVGYQTNRRVFDTACIAYSQIGEPYGVYVNGIHLTTMDSDTDDRILFDKVTTSRNYLLGILTLDIKGLGEDIDLDTLDRDTIPYKDVKLYLMDKSGRGNSFSLVSVGGNKFRFLSSDLFPKSSQNARFLRSPEFMDSIAYEPIITYYSSGFFSNDGSIDPIEHVTDKISVNNVVTGQDLIIGGVVKETTDDAPNLPFFRADENQTTINSINTKINSPTTTISSNTTIDGDLTVTGNLQADGLSLPENVKITDLEIQKTSENLKVTTSQTITNAGTDNITNSSSIYAKDPERETDYFQIGGRVVGNKDKQSSTVAFITAAHTSRTTGETKASWYHTDVQNLSDNSMLRRQILSADVHICQGSLQTSNFVGTLNQQNVKTFTDRQAAPVLANMFMAEQPIIPTSRADLPAGMSFRFIDNITTDPYLKNLYVAWKSLDDSYHLYESPVKFSSLSALNPANTYFGFLISFKGTDAKGTIAEILLTNISDINDRKLRLFARMDNNTNVSSNYDDDPTTSETFVEV